MKWWQWHILIVGGISFFYWLNRPGEWGMMFYAIPINLIIYLIPAYIITLVIRGVRSFTRKTTKHPEVIPQGPVEEGVDNQLPNMTRR